MESFFPQNIRKCGVTLSSFKENNKDRCKMYMCRGSKAIYNLSDEEVYFHSLYGVNLNIEAAVCL